MPIKSQHEQGATVSWQPVKGSVVDQNDDAPGDVNHCRIQEGDGQRGARVNRRTHKWPTAWAWVLSPDPQPEWTPAETAGPGNTPPSPW